MTQPPDPDPDGDLYPEIDEPWPESRAGLFAVLTILIVATAGLALLVASVLRALR